MAVRAFEIFEVAAALIFFSLRTLRCHAKKEKQTMGSHRQDSRE